MLTKLWSWWLSLTSINPYTWIRASFPKKNPKKSGAQRCILCIFTCYCALNGVYFCSARHNSSHIGICHLKLHHKMAQLTLYLHIIYFLSPNCDKLYFWVFLPESALGDDYKNSRIRVKWNWTSKSFIKNRSVKNKQWDEYLKNRIDEKSFYHDLFMENLQDHSHV